MSDDRTFLRVHDFDERQNPRRPKRPTWLKMFVRDLDDAGYIRLSLSVRGFLGDFQRLAADFENRVPDDVQFIARRLNTPPAVVAKALNTCLTHDFILRFAPPANSQKNKTLEEKSDSRPIPPSLSYSTSLSPSEVTTNSTTTRGKVTALHEVCPACDGEGCAWCRQGNVA